MTQERSSSYTPDVKFTRHPRRAISWYNPITMGLNYRETEPPHREQQTPSQPIEIHSSGKRIYLIQFTQADAKDIYELIRRSAEFLAAEGISQKYETLEAVQKSIQPPEDAVKLRFCIRNSQTGEFMGSINLLPDENKPHVGEIGYYIGEQYGGNGYTTEALTLLCHWAFRHTDISILVAYTDPNNIASQRVLEKAGFHRVGQKDEDDIQFMRLPTYEELQHHL